MAKLNYKELNPQKVSRMTTKELRAAYSAARGIFRKRNERIISKGLTPVYDTPIPTKNLTDEQIRTELVIVSAQLRDPLSSLKILSTREGLISATLKSHDYDIPISKLDDFGRFMDATRKRQGETYKGKSGVAATAYSELLKTGVSGKTIARSFKKWMESGETLNALVTAAQNAADSHPGKRVTAKELKKIMAKL